MTDRSAVTLWPGVKADSAPWVARSDAGWAGARASVGVALFNPKGEWVASVSREICAESNEATDIQRTELLALYEAAMLAREICPGQPLLMLSDCEEALSLVSRAGQQASGPVAREWAREIFCELVGRPDSLGMWMPREGNRLADALATRARATSHAIGATGISECELESLAKLDHHWLLAQPARDTRDFVRRGPALLIDKKAKPTSRRKMSVTSFARLVWLKLDVAERQTLAFLHSMPERNRFDRVHNSPFGLARDGDRLILAQRRAALVDQSFKHLERIALELENRKTKTLRTKAADAPSPLASLVHSERSLTGSEHAAMRGQRFQREF